MLVNIIVNLAVIVAILAYIIGSMWLATRVKNFGLSLLIALTLVIALPVAILAEVMP